MRLDKFLKISRIIKRRTIAKEISDNSRVEINGKIAKPSNEVKAGDVLKLDLNSRIITVRVLSTPEYVKTSEADKLYEVIEISKQ